MTTLGIGTAVDDGVYSLHVAGYSADEQRKFLRKLSRLCHKHGMRFEAHENELIALPIDSEEGYAYHASQGSLYWCYSPELWAAAPQTLDTSSIEIPSEVQIYHLIAEQLSADIEDGRLTWASAIRISDMGMKESETAPRSHWVTTGQPLRVGFYERNHWPELFYDPERVYPRDYWSGSDWHLPDGRKAMRQNLPFRGIAAP